MVPTEFTFGMRVMYATFVFSLSSVRNSWVLEGLVSWGPSTVQRISNGPQYGVFTRVARYLEWLQQKLQMLPDTVSCW